MKKLLTFTICILMCANLFSCEKETNKKDEQSVQTTYASNENSASKDNGANKAPSTTKPKPSTKE